MTTRVTPAPGRATLPPGTTLRRGDRGIAVVFLQRALNDHLPSLQYPSLDIDGSFGPKTETAVKEFQGRVHLKADGLAGRLTLTKLGLLKEPQPAPDPPDVPAPEPDPDLDGGYIDKPDKQMPWLGLLVLIAGIFTVFMMFASIR